MLQIIKTLVNYAIQSLKIVRVLVIAETCLIWIAKLLTSVLKEHTMMEICFHLNSLLRIHIYI